MPCQWKRLDRRTVQDFPVYLDDDDECYYAREYVSHGGYDCSEANRIISNFKKHPSKRNTSQWYWRDEAVRQFARELQHLLAERATVGVIPSSKRPGHPDYDGRFPDLLTALRAIMPQIKIVEPIRCRESHTPAHHGGDRHPDLIYPKLEWIGCSSRPEHIVLIDDLLTTGGHFKACKRIIQENYPRLKVIGVFWAKTIWPDRTDIDFEPENLSG
jgi:hypothetical protein